MTLRVPYTKSTRLQLPHGDHTVVGDEPANAMPGTLSYDPEIDTVRVKTSYGWVNVGGSLVTPFTTAPDEDTMSFHAEFDSLESLSDNFIIWNATDNVVLTRSGDATLGMVVVTSPNYRSSIYGGQLFIELPASKTIYIYRAVTGADYSYTGWITPSVADLQPNGEDGGNVYMFVSAATGSRPNPTGMNRLGIDPDLAGAVGRLWSGVDSVGLYATRDWGDDFAGYMQFTGTSYFSLAYSLVEGRGTRFGNQTSATTRAYCGFGIDTPSFSSGCRYILHFFREGPTGTFTWASTVPGPSTGTGNETTTGGGGGSGTLTEVQSADGSIIVTGGTGPIVDLSATPASVGALDADISAYSTITPDGADQVWLADASAADAPSRATLTSILESASIGTPTGNPYIDPPLSANAFDDEFESGTPDLAARGYTVKDSVGATLTRAGDITPWSYPSSGTYRSTIVGSQILVQFPATAQVFIYKLVTLAAGDTYYARAASTYRADAGSSGRYCVVGLCGITGGNVDGANGVYSSVYEVASGGPMNIDLFRVTAGATAGNTRTDTGFDIRGVYFVSGSTYFPFACDSSDGQTLTNSPAGAIAGSSVGCFFLQVHAGAASQTPDILSIDFIRKKTGSAWIASAPRPVAWGNSNIIAATGNPYVDPPVTASSLDDEFESGTPDLAARGWIVWNTTSSVVMTRVGDIVPYNTSLTSSQYRSTIIGSILHVQIGQGFDVAVYKAITAGSGLWIYGAMGAPLSLPGIAATQKAASLTFWANNAGRPDQSNRAYASMASTTSGPRFGVSRVTAGAQSDFLLADGNVHLPDVTALLAVNTNDYIGVFINSRSGSNTTAATTGAVNKSTIAYAGFDLWCPVATGSTADTQIFTLDFFRTREWGSGSWVAQTPRPVAWNVLNANIENYTTKSTPVSADQIWIADSAASNAVKRAYLSTAAVAASPLTGVSTSPDTWNLEARTWVSADFATNGWSITERDTATVLTRAGDVDFTATPAAGTYRSSLRGGGVVVQTRNGVVVQIAKAVTGTTNTTYKIRCRCLDYGTGYYSTGFVSDNINPSTTNARFYSIGLEQTTIVENLRVGPSTNTTYGTSAGAIYYNDFVCAVRSTSSSSMGSYYAVTDGPGIYGSSGRNTGLTIAYAGVSLYSATGVGYFFLDFIRRGTANAIDLLC